MLSGFNYDPMKGKDKQPINEVESTDSSDRLTAVEIYTTNLNKKGKLKIKSNFIYQKSNVLVFSGPTNIEIGKNEQDDNPTIIHTSDLIYDTKKQVGTSTKKTGIYFLSSKTNANFLNVDFNTSEITVSDQVKSKYYD